MVETSIEDNLTTIKLSPNRSVNWKELKLWLAFISFPSALISIGWLFQGIWIILIFAIIEIALVCYFMYRVCYLNYRKELITIEQQQVRFLSGVSKPEKEYFFSRQDCFLLVSKAIKPSDNLELFLGSDKQTLAIGEFLNNGDREIARKSLLKAGLIECSKKWWS